MRHCRRLPFLLLWGVSVSCAAESIQILPAGSGHGERLVRGILGEHFVAFQPYLSFAHVVVPNGRSLAALGGYLALESTNHIGHNDKPYRWTYFHEAASPFGASPASLPKVPFFVLSGFLVAQDELVSGPLLRSFRQFSKMLDRQHVASKEIDFILFNDGTRQGADSERRFESLNNRRSEVLAVIRSMDGLSENQAKRVLE